MRHRGADIRIIELPFAAVADGVRSYAASAGFRNDFSGNATGHATIRAAAPVGSHYRLWRHGAPQRVEWRIRAVDGGETRLETRFGLHAGFRLRFWAVIAGLFGLFFLSVGSGGFLARICCADSAIAAPCRMWFENAALCAACLSLLAGVGVAKVAIGGNAGYRSVVEGVAGVLKERHGPVNRRLIRSDYLFPDIFLLLGIYLGFALFSILLFGQESLLSLASSPLFRVLFLCIGWLLGLSLLSVLVAGFKERLNFTLLALQMLLPLLILYGLPHIDMYIFAGSFRPDTGPSPWPRETAGALSFLAAAANLFCSGVAVILFAGTPKMAGLLVCLRTSAFVPAPPDSIYRKALGFRSFAGAFTAMVLILWLTVTFVLYLCIFSVLSVLECGIAGEAALFAGRAGVHFFQILNWTWGVWLEGTGFGELAPAAARLTAGLYAGPLVWLLLWVARRRICARLRIRKEMRCGFRRSGEESYLPWVRSCRRMAKELGVRPPRVAVTPSPVPAVGADDTGVSRFQPVIFISRGCLKLTPAEVEGLLAHEMYHLRHHTFRWHLLNLLSDVSLCGTGFLNVVSNSYENELEADRFAVSWIGHRKIPAADYIRALKIVAMAAGSGALHSAQGIGGPGSGSNGPRRRNTAVRRFMARAAFLFELHFGDRILHYIHPPLDERIDRIREGSGGTERTRPGGRRDGRPS